MAAGKKLKKKTKPRHPIYIYSELSEGIRMGKVSDYETWTGK
jgi:hypothetical protein